MSSSPALGHTPPGARGARLGDEPTMSVVVASCRPRQLLDACLESLLTQCAAHGADVIVARACEGAELRDLERTYPYVTLVRGPAGGTIPQLRGLGMAAASGDIVALTEDHCVAAPDWVAQLRSGRRDGVDVMGGSMDNAQRDRAIDWAAYFAEYGFFAEDAGRTEAPLLTGANVAYSRRVIDQVAGLARQGEWENVAHDRLSAQGRTMQFIKTAAVYQNRKYQFADFCHDRFVHGRDYARRRLVDDRTARRLLLLPGCAVLPFVLAFRVSRAIASRHRGAFLRALPYTFAFLTAWSIGEATGYWQGPAPADASSE